MGGGGKIALTHLSFIRWRKSVLLKTIFIKLKKLVNFYHNFHFFTRNGMNNFSTDDLSAAARLNSGGAIAYSGEALFGLDFSLVRFFSSRKRNERPCNR